jgi:type IV pilus assembly protein PilA
MATSSDRGFTLIELILVVALISIVAALGIPGLLRARMTANETTAIATLHATASGEKAYSAACGNGGNAASYRVLGTPIAPGTDPFISADLALSEAPVRSGYTFTLDAGEAEPGPLDCHGRSTSEGFYATAAPISFGSTGTRAFATNLDGTVWQRTGPTPPFEPFLPSWSVSPVQ